MWLIDKIVNMGAALGGALILLLIPISFDGMKLELEACELMAQLCSGQDD